MSSDEFQFRAAVHDFQSARQKAGIQEVLALLKRLNSEFNKTIVIVTHDAHAAERAKSTLHLEKGDLVEKRAAVAAR